MRAYHLLSFVALSLPMFACSAADSGGFDFDAPEEVAQDEAPYSWATGTTKAPKTVLASAPNASLQAATPDRAYAVFSAIPSEQGCGSLFRVDTKAGSAVTITADGACSYFYGKQVAIDSQGEKVAFWTWSEVSSSFRLLLWSEGSVPVEIANHPGEQFTNELSVLHFAGNHLLYALKQPGGDFVMMAYDLAAGSTKAMQAKVALSEPIFDTARDKVLLRADGMGEAAMVLHDLAGGTATKVASGVSWEQSVSPDGRFVAFVSDCLDGAGECQLTVVDFATNDVFELDSNVSKVAGFLANGDKFVYVANGALKFWDIGEGTISQVPAAGVCWAVASPSASQVAFVSDCKADSAGQHRGALKAVDAAALGSVKSLGTGVLAEDTTVRLSPDGSRVAAVRFAAVGKSTWLEAWTIASGKRETVGQSLGTVTRTVGDFRFSPDGTKLVYERSSGWVGPCPPYGVCGYNELRGFDFSRYTLKDQNIDGALYDSVNLESALYDVWGPVPRPGMSPDGSRFAYLGNAASPLESVYTIDMDTLRKRKVPSSTSLIPVLMTSTHMLLVRNVFGTLNTDGIFVVALD